MRTRTVLILYLFCFLPVFIFGQKDTLIQFSGLVVTSDSLEAIPNTNIYVKSNLRGTVSNFNGFFSLIVMPGDVIVFSNIGYMNVEYKVPRGMANDRYSIIQLMSRDTIHLDETVIYPWPTPPQFKEAFLSLEIPDDELARAEKNLERDRLREIGEMLPSDANETLDFYSRTEAAKYYHYGQLPPMNIFNPIAWAQFIKAWKEGKFKKKK
jgi:signal peptidase I